MRILFLTDNFYPESNAPAIRTHEHARRWVERGMDVTVLTSAPNFPNGSVYNGYRNKLFQSETIDGIKVIRVWTFLAANEAIVLRLIDFLSFMISAFVAGLFIKKQDVIVGTSPQFFSICAAWALAKCKGCPFILELRDIWPESVIAVDIKMARVFLLIASKVAAFLYQQADRIVVVTNSTKEFLKTRGVDDNKIDVIFNGVNLELFKGKTENVQYLADKMGLSGKWVVGYIGTHGLAHSLEIIIEAAKLAEGLTEFRDVHFITVGSGAEFDSLKEKAADLQNITLVGQVPHEEIPKYWELLDTCVIHLRDTPLFQTVIPSKLFEAIGAGVPVLHGVKGESAQIVKSLNIGWNFQPQNPRSLLSAIHKIRSNAGELGRYRQNCISASEQFSRTHLADKMLNSLSKAQGIYE